MFRLECTNLEPLLPFQIERASVCAGAPSISTTVSGVTSTGASFPSCSSCSPCSSSFFSCSSFPSFSSFPCSSDPCPFGTAAHHLGAQRAERPGQVPHSRLPGVVGLLGRRRSRMQADRRLAQARRRGVDGGRRQRHHRPAPQQAQRPLRGFLGATVSRVARVRHEQPAPASARRNIVGAASLCRRPARCGRRADRRGARCRSPKTFAPTIAPPVTMS